MEFITKIPSLSFHLWPFSAGVLHAQGSRALIGEVGSPPCHVDMSVQCSSQWGTSCSKGNLVSEVLKQRTGKTIICREIWFIFPKIQLTHPLLPWQVPPMVWRNFFLLPPSWYCTPLAVVEGRWDGSEQAAGWPTLVTPPGCQAGLSSPSFFLLPWNFWYRERWPLHIGHCELEHSQSGGHAYYCEVYLPWRVAGLCLMGDSEASRKWKGEGESRLLLAPNLWLIYHICCMTGWPPSPTHCIPDCIKRTCAKQDTSP